MKNIQINADAVKAISCLSALLAESESNRKLSADDIAEIVNNYVETIVNINGDIKECIENVIFDFESNSGRIMKIKADKKFVIATVNALVMDLYGEDLDIDCSMLVEANFPRLDIGLSDFFRMETDFNVRVCYSHDKENLLIVYTEDY